MKSFNITVGAYVVCWYNDGGEQKALHQRQVVNDMIYTREEMILDPSIYQAFTLAYKNVKDVNLSIEEFIADKLQLSLDFVTKCITQKLTVFKRIGKHTNTIYLLTAPSKAVNML